VAARSGADEEGEEDLGVPLCEAAGPDAGAGAPKTKKKKKKKKQIAAAAPALTAGAAGGSRHPSGGAAAAALGGARVSLEPFGSPGGAQWARGDGACGRAAAAAAAPARGGGRPADGSRGETKKRKAGTGAVGGSGVRGGGGIFSDLLPSRDWD
jgi:hypothetical protein